MAAPARAHSSRFSDESAGELVEYWREIPRASMAEAMVLAVYIPPHAAGPGQLCWTISRRSASVILS